MNSKNVKEMKWILSRVKLGKSMAVSLVLLLFSMSFSVMEVWVQKYVIDALTNASCLSAVWLNVMFLSTIFGNTVFIFLLQYYTLVQAKNPIQRFIADNTLYCVHTLPLHEVNSKKRQYYVELLTHYAEEISDGIVAKITGLRYGLQCIAISGLLCYINPRMFVAILVLAVLYVGIGHYFTDLFWKQFSAYMEKTNQLHAVIEEGLSATREIILNNRRKWEEDRYHSYFDAYYLEAKRINRYGNLNFCITNLLKWLETLFVLVYGGKLVLNGTISVASYVVSYQLCSMLLQNMEQAYSELLSISGISAKIERLHDISLDEPVKEQKEQIDKITDILLQDVSYTYEKQTKKVLKHLDMDITGAKKIGIAGRSGCGKSTVAKLILSIIEPESGDISVNGTKFQNVNQEKLRNRIGYCRQEPYMFPDTIRNNITFGRCIDDEKLDEICNIAGIKEFIENLGDQYETELGDRGVNISGGQKQRIALARALAGEPEVLILDEATSALDMYTEKKIMEQLDGLCENGLTLIVIAHRLWTIQNADKIFMMEDGHVAETGKHKELVGRRGVYYQLVQEQE